MTVEFSQRHDAKAGNHVLELQLPRRAPDRDVSVVAVEAAGAIDVDGSLQQQAGGAVVLPAHAADWHPADYWGRMRMGMGGCVCDWYSPDNRLVWRFKVFSPGAFDVYLVTRAVSLFGWKGGHKVEVAVAGRKVGATLKADLSPEQAGAHYPVFTNHIGTVRIDDAGEHSLSLWASRINPEARGGLTASCIRLVPRPGNER